jgi:hypothetical protein
VAGAAVLDEELAAVLLGRRERLLLGRRLLGSAGYGRLLIGLAAAVVIAAADQDCPGDQRGEKDDPRVAGLPRIAGP